MCNICERCSLGTEMISSHMLSEIVGAKFGIGRHVEISSVHVSRVAEVDSWTVLVLKGALEGTVLWNDLKTVSPRDCQVIPLQTWDPRMQLEYFIFFVFAQLRSAVKDITSVDDVSMYFLDLLRIGAGSEKSISANVAVLQICDGTPMILLVIHLDRRELSFQTRNLHF